MSLFSGSPCQCIKAPCNCAGLIGSSEGGSMGGSSAENWVQLGMLGNQTAMQWYLLTHPQAQYPVQPSVIDVPGAHVAFNSNLLVLGVLGIIAFVILAK